MEKKKNNPRNVLRSLIDNAAIQIEERFNASTFASFILVIRFSQY